MIEHLNHVERLYVHIRLVAVSQFIRISEAKFCLSTKVVVSVIPLQGVQGSRLAASGNYRRNHRSKRKLPGEKGRKNGGHNSGQCQVIIFLYT
jgi:hypothetical protein